MQREDVYETGDLPESDQQIVAPDEDFDSEHIVRTKLKHGDALSQFRGKIVNAENADFSDKISNRHRKGYPGETYFVEVISLKSGFETESVGERYERLKYEISELDGQLQELKRADECEKDTKIFINQTDIAELQQTLKKLQIEQILTTKADDNVQLEEMSFKRTLESIDKAQKPILAKEGAPLLNYEFYNAASAASIGKDEHVQQFAALEAKLAVLEKLIGPLDSDKLPAFLPDLKSKTLDETIDSFNQRLALLDNGQLDLVDARLSVILHKVSQIQDKKSNMTADQNGTVDQLYKMMLKWDPICTSLPDVIGRLKALKELHEQATQFSQCIIYLDGIQQELNKTLDSNSTLLFELKDTINKNLETFKTNCENVGKIVNSRLKRGTS